LSASVVNSATCTFCGCVCDDIQLHTDGRQITESRNACSLGEAWFRNHSDHDLPEALIDGEPAPLESAIQTAAETLTRADMPLIYGLGNVTCEAQREALFLAQDIGGVIDSHTSITHGPTKIGVQLVGKVTSTLGEIRNRADLVIFWGVNPAESHPRMFSRCALDPVGKFVRNGRMGRTAVVVDVRETPSAEQADLFLQIQPNRDFEALTSLRAIIKGFDVDSRLSHATGLGLDQLRDLANRMKSARYGAIFFGQGLTATRGKHVNAAAVLKLVAELNEFTKFVIMPMRVHGNEAGADMIFSMTTGYPMAVSFNRGYPRSNPGEFTCADLLARGEVDAALIVGADPAATMPRRAAEYLARIPTIVLDPKTTATSRIARVHLPTAVTGISATGTAYRMDRVPIPLRRALTSRFQTDEELIRRLRFAVQKATV